MMTAYHKIRTDSILARDQFDGEDLVQLLSVKEDKEKHRIFRRAYEVKRQYTGNVVYLRGLIEMSNICRKDC
jgi:biotin synthase